MMTLLVYTSVTTTAQTEQKTFKDTTDGAFDISHFLLDLHGFLPVVSPITEPAVGYGAIVAGLYFIPKKDTTVKHFIMPDIVLAAGGVTSNKTWFAAAGYMGFWKQDRIRYRGILGYADVKLKYYGAGDGELDEHPVKFNLRSTFFLQQAIFRISDSKFLLGGRYHFSSTTITLFDDTDIPGLDPLDFDLKTSGVGVIAEYAGLNNIMSPTKGLRTNLTYVQNLELIGSDKNFGELSIFLHYYLPLSEKWISGFRIETQFAVGEPPFYALPYINLRGVPIMRYQGDITALIETEQFFMITDRWGIVGFGGVGQAYTTGKDEKTNSTAWNAGAGFRYLIARELGLRMGIDIARGPEEWAFYVVVGSAWKK